MGLVCGEVWGWGVVEGIRFMYEGLGPSFRFDENYVIMSPKPNSYYRGSFPGLGAPQPQRSQRLRGK